jgi:hypothetical protein
MSTDLARRFEDAAALTKENASDPNNKSAPIY